MAKRKADVVTPKSYVSGSPTAEGVVTNHVANEIFVGVVGALGSGTSEVASAIEAALSKKGYKCFKIKASNLIKEEAGVVSEKKHELTKALQDAGDYLRLSNSDNGYVAKLFIRDIRYKRLKDMGLPEDSSDEIELDSERRAYIIDSIRHPAEVSLLRKLYQDAFFLIGIHCEEKIRLERLVNQKYSEKAAQEVVKSIMDRDENSSEKYGQKVSDAFHLADYFVDNSKPRYKKASNTLVGKESNPQWKLPDDIGRLFDIVLHTKIVRPTIDETGMFHAYGSKMRSSCLSRQVGAALISSSGELISTGTNEVPRAGGGVYNDGFSWVEGSVSGRDFRCHAALKKCTNVEEQNKIIEEILNAIKSIDSTIIFPEKISEKLRKTRVGQILEYSRAVHAEMDAIISAGRRGMKTEATYMYVTTFPCHNCARHIVTAGIEMVQYIEPYLKSQALPLHGDAIVTDQDEWNVPSAHRSQSDTSVTPNVLFKPFIGVAPRLYRRAFLKDRELKDSVTGGMLELFPGRDSGEVTDTLKTSYAQIEAILSRS